MVSNDRKLTELGGETDRSHIYIAYKPGQESESRPRRLSQGATAESPSSLCRKVQLIVNRAELLAGGNGSTTMVEKR